MMKIYTKRGDAGETSLLGGVVVSKDDLRIRTYGTFDELNSVLGLVLTERDLPQELRTCLERIQRELFQLGSELATPSSKKSLAPLLHQEEVAILEREIDSMEEQLSPLQTFILPGGARSSALLHLARTVCRRAERELVNQHHRETVRSEVLQYINRLSDYFFVCARLMNHQNGISDVPWSPRSVAAQNATKDS